MQVVLNLPIADMHAVPIPVSRPHYHEPVDCVAPLSEGRNELLRLAHLKGLFGAGAVVQELHSDAQHIVSQSSSTVSKAQRG